MYLASLTKNVESSIAAMPQMMFSTPAMTIMIRRTAASP